jgi:glycine hydroxymethyltransferase
MKEKEMQQIAEWIEEAVTHNSDDKFLNNLHLKITKFTKDFPLPE